MALDKPLFDAIAPEFKKVSGSVLNVLTLQAEIQVKPDQWGSRENLGKAYLVAHMLKLAQRKGSGGSITSQKVGDLSRNFNPGEIKDSYDQTSYGKEYKRIRRQLLISPVSIC